MTSSAVILLLSNSQAQVVNGSFENNGFFDLTGWTVSNCAQLAPSFGPPPGGGTVALEMNASSGVCSGQSQLNRIHQKLPWVTNGMPLRVSWWWSKSINAQGGSLCVGVVNNGWQGCNTFWSGGIVNWIYKEEDYSPTLGPGDTAAVAIFGGISSGSGAFNYFDEISVISTVGIPEYEQVTRFRPNPVMDRMWVDLAERVLAMELIDGVGRSVDLPAFTQLERTVEVDMRQVPSGPHVLRLRTATGVRHLRFLKC